MDNSNTGTFDIYKDISARTNGEIYIGVVGGVRSGKSTFTNALWSLWCCRSWKMKTKKTGSR